MDYAKESLRLHAQWQGNLDIQPKMQITCLLYTSGDDIIRIMDMQGI